MESIIIVTLQEKYPDPLGRMKVINSESKAFASMEKAESWLYDNGFRIGRRSFFDYRREDTYEWIHKYDVYWNYVDVSFEQFEVNDNSKSIFRGHYHRIGLELQSFYFEGESGKFRENTVTEFKSMAKAIEAAHLSQEGKTQEKS